MTGVNPLPEPRHTQVNLPQEPGFLGARYVVDTLRRAGHESWIVGGAVRDMVMGLSPEEFDIATSATPEAVMKLFRRTVPVGVRFGVVRVLERNQEYEVATFRADGGYSDGRRPDAVRFTNLEEDVSRRDFTMNGLALDPGTGDVTDLVGGLADIASGTIRAIGDAALRFGEDHLRPLRALRFAAQTGFEVEEATLVAVRAGAGEIGSVSVERIRDELEKILNSRRPGRGLRLARDTGVLREVLPELAGTDEATAADDILDALVGSSVDTLWSALFRPLGPTGAAAAMGRLHHSRRMAQAVEGILESTVAIRTLPQEDEAAEKRTLRSPWAKAGLAVEEARLRVTGDDRACIVYASGKLSEWTPSDLFPDRLVTGEDALEAGILGGPAVGDALTAVEDEQLRGNIRSREQALAFLANLRQVENDAVSDD